VTRATILGMGSPTSPFTTLLASASQYARVRASFHAIAPGSLDVEARDEYTMAVHVGRPHHLWEHREGSARHGAHRRGDVVVMARGELCKTRWDRDSSFFSIQVAPDLVSEVAAGFGVNPDRVDIVGAFSHRDPEIAEPAFALLRELAAGMPSGAMFGEAIGAQIATRLIEGYASKARVLKRESGGLASATLTRTISYLHDAMSERITLSDLARLADLSPFHFARQFQRSTGLPPHAYLLRVRVEEAARLILGGLATPSEAALRVGFSSQGHLTRQMQRTLGVTPGYLRARGVGRRR
jgi:AraC family transcriptional regulator